MTSEANLISHSGNCILTSRPLSPKGGENVEGTAPHPGFLSQGKREDAGSPTRYEEMTMPPRKRPDPRKPAAPRKPQPAKKEAPVVRRSVALDAGKLARARELMDADNDAEVVRQALDFFLQYHSGPGTRPDEEE
jgi:hypothetical protein